MALRIPKDSLMDKIANYCNINENINSFFIIIYEIITY